MVNIVVIGSRNFDDYNLLENTLSSILYNYSKHNLKVCIITGDAKFYDENGKIVKDKSTDMLVQKYAKKHHLPLVIFNSIRKYGKYLYSLLGNDCYFIRNKMMIDNLCIENMTVSCDMLVAFWDGVSGGTKQTIEYAKQMNKYVKVIEV